MTKLSTKKFPGDFLHCVCMFSTSFELLGGTLGQSCLNKQTYLGGQTGTFFAPTLAPQWCREECWTNPDMLWSSSAVGLKTEPYLADLFHDMSETDFGPFFPLQCPRSQCQLSKEALWNCHAIWRRPFSATKWGWSCGSKMIPAFPFTRKKTSTKLFRAAAKSFVNFFLPMQIRHERRGQKFRGGPSLVRRQSFDWQGLFQGGPRSWQAYFGQRVSQGPGRLQMPGGFQESSHQNHECQSQRHW